MFLELPVATTFALFAVLLAVEVAGPVVAERRKGGTPWHAHHIAERYGLLVIITLGEGIIGTVAALNAVVHGEAGWTVDAVLSPSPASASRSAAGGCTSRSRGPRRWSATASAGFTWGYGHILIFGALAAIGAGLHVAAPTPRARGRDRHRPRPC